MPKLRTSLLVLVLALFAAAAARAATTVDVTVGPGNSFSPKNVTLQAGDSVRWTSAGGTHNVVADDDSFSSGAPGSGWTFTRTFAAAGTFPYYCQVHGGPGGLGMSGSVSVQGGASAPGSLRFALASSSISEAGGAATISVQRVNGDDGAVSVAFATANGSAQAGSDYTAASGTLDWGDKDDSPKTFQIPITDDGADEANETVQLSLSNPTGGAILGSPAAATLTIQDNDTAGGGSPGTLRLASASYSAAEGGGNATLSVVRDGGTDGAVSANWATADGSALAGSDYAASAGTVGFGAGDSAAKTIEIPILDDGAEEAPESFTVALSGPAGGAALGNPSSATVTLTDDDFPTVCVEDEHTLCLNQGRFRVRTTWTDFAGVSGQAFALPYTADSGFFYFFDAANLEILVKVLDACNPFQRYWVYFAVASNVEYQLEVVDTQAGQVKAYFNPAGTYAPATGDNDAFATCP